ncbi:ABC transporter permease [Mucilaginibacter sp. KACC 22063]|uniref:ABC transporter permease n=1 Tax=Mucilaginibacter sp. KACC 22063 TaxID=3025666 RepID=UPI002365CB6C|nr:ABC transporter permease [Mucilaginibacter sp. KACC 22063]WDF53337.1 ABC transporter permease [Mucilaginibacter sp. KACC 22063]
MIKNFLKIAFRNMLRHKGYFAINVLGLAIGLSICLMISLFVIDELSYDRYNENADRIYRVNTEIKVNGSGTPSRSTPAPLADKLMKDYPQIEQATRIGGGDNMLVLKGTETFIEPGSFFADANIFNVFSLPLIAGDTKTALAQPNTMVVSASMARKYFNSTDVIGKTLKVNNSEYYKITGVIEDMPAASHLHFNSIRSVVSQAQSRSDFWLNNMYSTYVLVRPGVTRQNLDSFLRTIAAKYAEPQVMSTVHSSFADLEKKGDYFKYKSIPLTEIHLHSNVTNEAEPSGDVRYVYMFILIGIIIIAIACVNFTNLSTARSAGRSKEVGIRKVLGSDRKNLITQFLTESIITSLIALTIALVITMLCLPYFNQIAGKAITFGFVTNIKLLIAVVLVTVVIGFLAGIYPAFYLSAFEPIQVLKGRLSTGFKGSWLRNILVVFQFTAAIVLIVCTLIIYSQLQYIHNKDLGYNREHVVVLKNAYALGDHAQAFKNEVLKIPGVTAGARAGTLPTESANQWNTNALSKDATMNAANLSVLVDWSVDADYINALGIKMASGRNFSPEMATDSNAILINETAARELGLRNPLQEKLFDLDQQRHAFSHQIIGVVKDFNAGSLRDKTLPMVFRLTKYGDSFIFRIQSKDIHSVMTQIENKYHAMDSNMAGQPFLFSFLDEDFNKLYQSEQRTGKLFVTFALLTILIACLGLFGLITYAAEQRNKEIGIRKVLGASVANVTALLSMDFIKLVLVAIVLASPIAWIAMHQWLQGFAYRVSISGWSFLIAAMSAIIIALSTVSFQALKAALANPVNSLRSE